MHTGRVLDYEVKSLFCHECAMYNNDDPTSEKFLKWKQLHESQCMINHKGSSDAMESEGAVEIFLRSVDKGLRYTTFVGDDDSSCFGDVHAKCLEVYGDEYTVRKEECVGHVQKRLGRGLREYKRKAKGTKLPDGKTAGGKGRLTDKVCDRMQNYFGTAIRSNAGNKEGMQKAIWAIYHHMIRDDRKSLEDQHEFCPKTQETWCKFWKQDGSYNDAKRLPPVFLNELRPLFERLSEDELLQRCLMGLTQNQNEALNGILWAICPKIKFCGRMRLETAVCEAVCHFNKGATFKLEIMTALGIQPGKKMKTALLKQNKRRIKNAAVKISLKYRQHRRKRRADKKSKDNDQVVYMSGAFGLTSTPEILFEKEGKRKKEKSSGQKKKVKRVLIKEKCQIARSTENKKICITFVDETQIKMVKDMHY